MKKWLMMLASSLFLLLSGCSLLNDTRDSLNYLNEATDYLTIVNDFANEAPALAQRAIEDLQAAEDLKSLLQDMQQQIESFNALQPPDFAAELHQQIIEQNHLITIEIEEYLTNFNDGLLDPAVLQNNELLQSLNEISSLISQIQQLGE